MATKITPESIRAMPIHKRHDLYKAALTERAKGNADADIVLRMLEETNLPYSDDTALRSNDPVVQKIAEIAFSKEGTLAMERAIGDGLPPMAGLDPLLAGSLGNDYGAHNQSTNWAGRLAAERMEKRGYKRTATKASLPEGCIARSAEVMR